MKDFLALLGILGVAAWAMTPSGKGKPQPVAKGPLHPVLPPSVDGLEDGPLLAGHEKPPLHPGQKPRPRYRSWKPDAYGPSHSLN